MKKPEIRFKVWAETLNPETEKWELLVERVELRDPAYYKQDVLKEELLKQHPEIKIPTFKNKRGETLGRAWLVHVEEWYD